MSTNNDDLLRVQGLSLRDVTITNQSAQVQRFILEAVVAGLFPQSHQEVAQTVRLVVDASQLAALRDALAELELPESGAGTPRPSVQ